MTLEQLVAFNVIPDHARQVQVWDVINSSWNKELFQIRRMLTETSIRVSDQRAVFVGVDAYEAARWTLPYGYSHGLRSLSGDPAPMTTAAHAKLLAQYSASSLACWKRTWKRSKLGR